MNLSTAKKIKPNDTIWIRKEKKTKTVKSVEQQILIIRFNCTDGTTYTHIQTEEKQPDYNKHQPTINKCPCCGGTVLLEAKINLQIRLGNGHNKTRLEQNNKELKELTQNKVDTDRYHCTCRDCKKELTAIPTMDPNKYIIMTKDKKHARRNHRTTDQVKR